MSSLHGYAGRILRVDLTSGRTSTVPTSDYASFVGGRGLAAKVHWDEVSPHVSALDPENRLTFFTGPFAGFAGFGSSRWQVCGKSPATNPEHFCYSNLGGTWSVTLKSAGYDGIIVQLFAGSAELQSIAGAPDFLHLAVVMKRRPKLPAELLQRERYYFFALGLAVAFALGLGLAVVFFLGVVAFLGLGLATFLALARGVTALKATISDSPIFFASVIPME
jgi:hypothetical protein